MYNDKCVEFDFLSASSKQQHSVIHSFIGGNISIIIVVLFTVTTLLRLYYPNYDEKHARMFSAATLMRDI